MDYTIASMEEVVLGRVEKYITSLRLVKDTARRRARTLISPFVLKGITPGPGEYAEVPIRPAQFSETKDAKSFRQEFGTAEGWTPSWQDLLTADLSDTGELNCAYVMGVVGLGIYDAVKRITEIELISSDYTFPVINIESNLTAKGPVALLFDITESDVETFVWDKNRTFKLRGYIETKGFQRFAPLGMIYLSKEYAMKETFA